MQLIARYLWPGERWRLLYRPIMGGAGSNYEKRSPIKIAIDNRDVAQIRRELRGQGSCSVNFMCDVLIQNADDALVVQVLDPSNCLDLLRIAFGTERNRKRVELFKALVTKYVTTPHSSSLTNAMVLHHALYAIISERQWYLLAFLLALGADIDVLTNSQLYRLFECDTNLWPFLFLPDHIHNRIGRGIYLRYRWVYRDTKTELVQDLEEVLGHDLAGYVWSWCVPTPSVLDPVPPKVTNTERTDTGSLSGSDDDEHVVDMDVSEDESEHE